MSQGYAPNPYAQQAPMPQNFQQQFSPYQESAEQRLARLSQQYGVNPYQNMPMNPPQNMAPQPQPQQAQTYECRPVTSIDEVKAIQVDFSGRPQFYFNQASGEVYVKQLNGMGASDYYAGKLQKVDFSSGQPVLPQEENAAPQYATQEELNALRDEMSQMIGGLQHECKCDGKTATTNAKRPTKSNTADNAKSDVSAGKADDAG